MIEGNFTEDKRNNSILPPWNDLLGKDDFISYMPSYKGNQYLDKFDECVLPCSETGDITYYVYNPFKHNTAVNEKCPVLVWIHGYTNALDGKVCVSHSGGEMFASPEYQKKMGGAFVVVPLANEKRSETGEIVDSWSEVYVKPVKQILDIVCDENKEHIGCKFIMGGSSGGYFSWWFAQGYCNEIDGCIPISSGYIPEKEDLKHIEEAGVYVLAAHGRHDELCSFDEFVKPKLEYLENMKNCICYFPEWVRNGDGGVASLYYGFEMGQHCMITQVQSNLIFEDGRCYDNRLPNGVTGWIADVCKAKQ